MSKYISIIGRSEPVDIVGSALEVPAKIDTGAYRSSIHVNSAKVKKKDGVEVLVFEILGHPASPVPRIIETQEFTQLAIRNSSGVVDNRYEVTLKIKLGKKIFNTSFTLADRKNNVFPVLIGRRALQQRFLVDVTKVNVRRLELLKNLGINPDTEEDFE